MKRKEELKKYLLKKLQKLLTFGSKYDIIYIEKMRKDKKLKKKFLPEIKKNT